ncbi:MAG: endonuclease III [Thermoprotei archaeon]|nr:MAG: endonuclease III [Thermoprotei archaeon]RLF14167.1 MAG: endonuclease III [Thermoprotei archaeon]
MTSRASEIYRVLKENFERPVLPSLFKDPFQVLVITVISQNTNDLNTERAYRNLEERGLLSPEAVLKASVEELEDALRVAGLYRNKARRLKELAEVTMEEYGGDLSKLLELPLEEARRRLLELPGVGYKTADVVLLFCGRRPVIPVDTHVNRTAKRLGLASPRAGYEEVRLSLQSLYPSDPELYLDLHLLLISLGRKYCKAGRPLCDRCPLSHLCPSASSERSSFKDVGAVSRRGSAQ